MTGPPPGPLTRQPPLLQLNNAQVVENLFDLLGIKDFSLRMEIIPAVLPVAVLQLPDPTKDEKLAFGLVRQVAVPLENAHCQIFNPAGSGRTIHVDSVLFYGSAGSEYTLDQFDTAITTDQASKGFRDRRVPGTPVGQIRRQTNVGALSALTRGRFAISAANVVEAIPIDAYLDPGQGLLIQQLTVNLIFTCTYYWAEIQPGQRT